MEVPQSKSGFMEVAVCAIFDGQQIHMGLSPGYEWPKRVIARILTEGLDGSLAMKAEGFTRREKMGEHEGCVGIFTKGKMTRTQFNKAAVIMAMMHLENPGDF